MIIAAALLLILQSAPATPPTVVVTKPKKICRTVEDTGTRMSRNRVCKTAEDWARDRQQAEDFVAGRQLDVDRPNGASTPTAPQ